MGKAIITIMFDDNSPTIYNEGFIRMRPLGLVGNHAVITGNLTNDPASGLITRQQMQEMYDAGWSILNHTRLHKNLLNEDDASVTSEVMQGRQDLIDNGWTRSKDDFVPPFNSANEHTLSIIKQYARSCTAFLGPDVINTFPFDPYRIGRFGAGTNSVFIFKSWIDRAIDRSGQFHIYFHSIADPIGYPYPPSMFQEVMNYIAMKRDQGLVSVVTVNDLMTNYTARKRYPNG